VDVKEKMEKTNVIIYVQIMEGIVPLIPTITWTKVYQDLT